MIQLGEQPRNYLETIKNELGETDYLGHPYPLADGSIMIPVEGRGSHIIIKQDASNQWTWKLTGMDVTFLSRTFTDKDPERLALKIGQSISKTVGAKEEM